MKHTTVATNNVGIDGGFYTEFDVKDGALNYLVQEVTNLNN